MQQDARDKESAPAAPAPEGDAAVGDGAGAAAEDKAKKRRKKKHARKRAQRARHYSAEAHPALAYLHAWQQQPAQWRFQKVRQVYLLRHMYDLDRVPKADFGVLLGYIEGLQGRSRADCLAQVRRCCAPRQRDALQAKAIAAGTQPMPEPEPLAAAPDGDQTTGMPRCVHGWQNRRRRTTAPWRSRSPSAPSGSRSS